MGYERYGGKGIKVCQEWLDSFEKFLEDMGERPLGKTLDRKDSSKGYFKENCRWSTPNEQARNRKSNVFIEFEGEKLCLVDWCKRKGISVKGFTYRLKHGWTLEEALNIPPDPRYQRRKKAGAK